MSRKVVALKMSREELRRAEVDEKERTAEQGTAAGLTGRGLADEEPSGDQISLSEGDAGDIRLERIVFIGRTYDEYLRMFNLKPGDLKGRTVLDCPGGACSFTAKARQIGIEAVAADIAYQFDPAALEAKGRLDIGHAVQHVESLGDQYRWDEFDGPEGLRSERTKALTATVEDMEQHPERYVAAALPVLPFADRQFDMTLSAHFLFMYSDKLDYAFHEQTVAELMRVTKGEIRIFPLVDQSSRRYEDIEKLLTFAAGNGWSAEERPSDYEFQRGASSMLVLRRN
ncbi:ubiquinone/menaquinone biosynthesis C-methylase UbiE [Paenibacillus favisporus]|uniref:Ubiquinone/menaquinone biosynthesis C-methylase UbiE n=1 Tax=Paenibacillus favisporus TaxID=221028 RepID=A0ABV2EWX2_9BACL